MNTGENTEADKDMGAGENKLDCAWCTLVMLDEAYAAGAVVVAESLKAVGSKYPIYCMVVRNPARGRCLANGKMTKNYAGISRECVEFMRPHFAGIIEVSFLTASTKNMRSTKQDEIYGDWINHCFTKGWILDPTKQPARKMMFLDADMMFNKNCDELFDLPAPAMTFSSPWAYPYHVPPPDNPLSRGHYNPYWNDTLKRGLAHGELVPADAIEAGLRESVVGFACMMLVEPSTFMMNEFLREIKLLPEDRIAKKIARESNQPPNGESLRVGYGKCISGFDEQVFAAIFLRTNTPCYNIHQRYNWIVGKDNWLAAELNLDNTNDSANDKTDDKTDDKTPYTQQWYNGKPWNQKGWPDLIAWWKLADKVIAEGDKTTSSWFYRNTSSNQRQNRSIADKKKYRLRDN